MSKQKELEKKIIYHKQQYYTGRAEISDAEYDNLEEELKNIAPDSYVLSQVGFTFETKKIKHNYPMLSLDKRRNPDEIISWMDGEPCMVSYKMDGSSASLVYENGIFKLAKSRGDGIFGENLTSYFKYIKFPAILFCDPLKGKTVEIRGEVCISRNSFYLLADKMSSKKLERPKSIRNIVAGLLHKKNDLELCTYLDFIAYELFCDDLKIETEQEKFNILECEKFKTPWHTSIKNKTEFNTVLEEYQNSIESGDYLTDGLVLAINNLKIQRDRGITAHHPKGKMAFKFKSDVAETTIENIIVDVGRTGKITFVAQLSPVELSGATVRNVTLNNAKYIENNNINTGCQIEITRSGEVIPKYLKTIKENGVYELPQQCPSCGGNLERSVTGIDLMCKNFKCTAQLKGKIANWIDVTGIENIGPSTLDRLYDLKLVTTPIDLYSLKGEDIADIDGLGKKSADKIIENINTSKNLKFATFLTALGIDGLGKGVAALIAEKYPSFEHLQSATVEDLKSINGIGEILAGNLIDGMNKFGSELYKDLLSKGVKITGETVKKGDVFKDKTFVITGKLSKSRKEIADFIKQNGGKVTGSVSKNTTFLVCNEPSESSKSKKAKSLNISIISEDELFKI